MYVNLLSTNPTKWSNTLKQFVGNLPTNCLNVFDHFVKLALKELIKVIIAETRIIRLINYTEGLLDYQKMIIYRRLKNYQKKDKSFTVYLYDIFPVIFFSEIMLVIICIHNRVLLFRKLKNCL